MRVAKKNPILAWHFVADKLRDGRPIPADGEVLSYDEPIELCASGLHASIRLIDALQYAPGGTICRVSCFGNIKKFDDKLVCTRRTILWRIENSDELLRSFARKCALSVADLWDMPTIVREYLETGDESKRAAARAAAWDAAGAAARAAARAAAWGAARAAAWAAAGDAARAAAWAAAGDAARAAKLDEFNSLLAAMVILRAEELLNEG